VTTDYIPRRASDKTSGRFQPAAGKYTLQPIHELAAALTTYADTLDDSADRADKRGSHWVANADRRIADEIRAIVKEHTS
jgi:hypothetical protein